jgi:hypothetical protein
VGGSIGSCIAGGIYTNTIIPTLYQYLPGSPSAATVEALANSITGVLPDWGTVERIAINYAVSDICLGITSSGVNSDSQFSDVLKFTTYAALGASIIGLALSIILPDLELPDRNNLIEE